MQDVSINGQTVWFIGHSVRTFGGHSVEKYGHSVRTIGQTVSCSKARQAV
jgi:hypothetical protein